MIQENLPSVDSLVSRIRSRINSRYTIEAKSKLTTYLDNPNAKSPVK